MMPGVHFEADLGGGRTFIPLAMLAPVPPTLSFTSHPDSLLPLWLPHPRPDTHTVFLSPASSHSPWHLWHGDGDGGGGGGDGGLALHDAQELGETRLGGVEKGEGEKNGGEKWVRGSGSGKQEGAGAGRWFRGVKEGVHEVPESKRLLAGAVEIHGCRGKEKEKRGCRWGVCCNNNDRKSYGGHGTDVTEACPAGTQTSVGRSSSQQAAGDEPAGEQAD